MEETTKVQENKMGVMPENKLLISMAVPMMLSMLVQALYNVVDSIFVARISEDALTAVSLAFPVQNLMIAVGAGTGVGVNALLSKSLGEKNQKMANKAAHNGILLMLFSFIACALFGLFGSRWFFTTQTEDLVLIEYGQQYLSVVMLFSFGLYGQFITERLLQATGRTLYTMVTQGLGAIINIILDPIMIFGLLGFPALGITGAAVATVVGQMIAALLGLWFNVKKNPDIQLSVKELKLDGGVIRKIYSVGVPSIIMGSIGSVMTYGMNRILMGFSSTAAAVFGVYFKLQSFFFMPVFGLNNGMVPIIAYNYGARKKERIMKTLKLAIMYAVSIMIVGFLVMQIFPAQLFLLFDASADMLAIGVPALRFISISFIFAGYCIIAGSMFQALGHGVLSMVNSLARQLFVLLPVAYLLSLTGNLNLIWLSFPIAELVSLTLSSVFLYRIYQKVIKPL
ncbi:MAG: MATE family efflux transporter [Lachnospiraceae bacterium]|nr:MATE family efflux transporter [Lachnospiraceae bacterium]